MPKLSGTAPELPSEVRKLLPLTPAVLYVLLSLLEGSKHGYAIMQETLTLSSGAFRMGPATLYTTIQKLVALGLVVEREAPDADARRRFYELTRSGRELLEIDVRRLQAAVRLAAKRRGRDAIALASYPL